MNYTPIAFAVFQQYGRIRTYPSAGINWSAYLNGRGPALHIGARPFRK